MTDPGTNVTGWPGRRSMNTQLLGSFSLENSATVWIVHRVDEIPQLDAVCGKVTKFKSGKDVDLSKPGIRGIIMGTATDGSRFMMECATEISEVAQKKLKQSA